MKTGKRPACFILAALMLAAALTACGGSQQKEDGAQTAEQQQSQQSVQQSTAPVKKDVTLKVLMDWNGSGSIAAKDPLNNPVAKALKEKTGVTLEVEYATTAENEKLNMVFASGDMPDIINGPLWGLGDPNTDIFVKAAKQGMLLPLDELVDKHSPFLKTALTKSLAKDFVENILEDPAYGGKHYFLPWQTPATHEDITNWAYNVWIRKDILEALKVNPSDIKSSEDLYELLKKIKEGGFKDINGKPVIPSGSFANGYLYTTFLNSFAENTTTEFIKVDDRYRYGFFSPFVDKQVLFMRKLVSEGLIDVECFRQDDSKAKEKMAAGKIAVFGSHYPNVRDFFTTTLYKEHPEMEYVPLGPILNANGEQCMPGQRQLDGRAGTPALVLPKTCADPEAAIKFLDYINTDEGKRLICYGIEGTHYTMVDGKPRLTDEWLQKYKQDPQNLRNEGIQSCYTWLISLDDRVSKWGTQDPGVVATVDEKYENAKKISPNVFVSGYRVNYFKNQYPDIDKINSLLDPNTQRDVSEKAYFAKSDAEALSILNAYRQQLIKGGIEDYENFINEKAATRNDIIN